MTDDAPTPSPIDQIENRAQNVDMTDVDELIAAKGRIELWHAKAVKELGNALAHARQAEQQLKLEVADKLHLQAEVQKLRDENERLVNQVADLARAAESHQPKRPKGQATAPQAQ